MGSANTVLANGMRARSDLMPSVGPISLGIWFDAGSRHVLDPGSGALVF